MITFKEAYAAALRLNDRVNRCNEYKDAFHFFKYTEEEIDGDSGLVILKRDGRAVDFIQFINEFQPEKGPKAIDIENKLKSIGICERVYIKYPDLMNKLGIDTSKQVIEELGDGSHEMKRRKLFEGISREDAKELREYFIRNCRAGIDRFPACLEIRIDHETGVFQPTKDSHIVTRFNVKYDRIKAKFSMQAKTNSDDKFDLVYNYGKGLPIQEIETSKPESVFRQAERAYCNKDKDINVYAVDAPVYTVLLRFADGTKIRYFGPEPDMAEHYLDGVVKELRKHIASVCPSVRV